MAGIANNSDTACGRDARTQGPLPMPQAGGGSKDWYWIALGEWMWRRDGLGLRPGAELMVYAAIYSASAHGGGVFLATIRSVAMVLDYPRETVSRAVGSLCKRGLIRIVGEVRDERGQNPQKCYAVSQQIIDLTQSSIDATCLEMGICPVPTGATQAVAESRDSSKTSTANRQAKGARGMAQRPSRSSERPADVSGCDESSHPADSHDQGQGTLPAETGVFDNQRTRCDESSHGGCDETSHGGSDGLPRDETSHPTELRAQEQGIQPAETTLFNIESMPCDESSHGGCDETSQGGRDVSACDETSHPTGFHTQEQGTRPAEMVLFNNDGQGCDESSHAGCDETSHVTKHHTSEQGILPAETGVFNNPLISTNNRLLKNSLANKANPDEVEEEEEEQKGEGDRPLTVAEEQAFEILLRASIRPVDAKYVDDNKAEFTRLVRAGVPCDVILEAYGNYARYQREQVLAGGELRSMHLLNWLKQNPNKNIQYVLNSKSGEWTASRKGTVRASAGKGNQGVPERRERVSGSLPKRKYSHENPKLDRCIDRTTVIWYVVDERGGRLVQGSRGVMDKDEARRLYDVMYEDETTGRR